VANGNSEVVSQLVAEYRAAEGMNYLDWSPNGSGGDNKDDAKDERKEPKKPNLALDD
jgi:hypothetical protein